MSDIFNHTGQMEFLKVGYFCVMGNTSQVEYHPRLCSSRIRLLLGTGSGADAADDNLSHME